MPRISILPPAKASEAAQLVYDEFHKTMEFHVAPNFIMTLGHSPDVARGTWELVRNVLVGGEIPRWKKEIIFVAISKERQCRYCAAVHLACCQTLGVKPEILEQLEKGVENISHAELRDMILFAVKCSKNPQGLLDHDFSKLYEHGLGMSQIMELIAMSALAVYANIIADATCMDPDAMFPR